MLKKINILMVLWIALFTVQCISESVSLRYEVYCDSAVCDELEVKQKVLDVYKELIQGLDQDKRAAFVLKNAEQFQLEKNWTIQTTQDTIKITIGNGKGMMLSGEFEWVMCSNEVKPRSWFKEMMGFYKE